MREFGIRYMAEFLDTVIYFGIAVLITVPFVFISRGLSGQSSQLLVAVQMALTLGSFVALQIYQLHNYSATFGYQLMNTLIKNPDGSNLSAKQSTIRVMLRLVMYLLFPILIVFLYHVLRMWFNQGKKDSLDELMGTVALFPSKR